MSDIPTHTPGPWIAKWSLYEIGHFVVQAAYPSLRIMADFGDDDDEPDYEDLANARLIAAAPELLEALLKALNFIENTESEFGDELSCGTLARAAIKKATNT